MKPRIKASLLHLLFSASIVTITVGLTLAHFYPGVFFDIENTSDALKILIPADIILGPLLTLIIYKKGKWGLKFDLAFIFLCQLTALAYGCWSIYSARPGFLVFHGDTFYMVPPKIDQTALKNSPLKVGSLDSPQIIYFMLPGDLHNRFTLAMRSTMSGTPIHWQSQYYQAFENTPAEVLKKASIDPEALKKKSDAKTMALLDKISKDRNNGYALIPVIGMSDQKVIAVNIATKSIDYTLNVFPD